MVYIAPNVKNKTTLLSSTLKVEESKVCLFFLFETILIDFLPFYGFSYFSKTKQKIKKWPVNEEDDLKLKKQAHFTFFNFKN